MRAVLTLVLLASGSLALAQEPSFGRSVDRDMELLRAIDLRTPPKTTRTFSLPLPAALATKPTLADRWAGRAEAVRLLNEGLAQANAESTPLPKAIATLGESIQSSAVIPEAHYALGVCLYQSRLFDEAREHFAEAVRLRPGYVQASKGLTQSTYAIQLRGLP